MNSVRTLLGVAGLLIAAGSPVFAQKQPAASEPSSVLWKAPAAGQGDGYVGVEICNQCHRVRVEQLGKTVHFRTGVAVTKAGTSCEACHGPGKAHADAELEAERNSKKNPEAKKLIFGFHGAPQENAARCLTCHQASKEHDLYGRSEHKMQGISCDQCHSAHLVLVQGAGERSEPSSAQSHFFAAPKLREETRWINQSLLRQPQPDLCFSCHRTIQAQFALPTHHRVPEGLMKCTDCHNPHGTLNRPLLKKANWETCVGCHVEKRGPYVYEHASVKVEGCVICHNPHGSSSRMLLRASEGRFLCLSCHVSHRRLSYNTGGECVRCHAVIHGSNSSPFYLR